jgi:hypothetical protein
MYTLQYNGKTMPYKYSKSSGADEVKYFWMKLIKPYSSDDLRMCPSVKKIVDPFAGGKAGTNKTPWHFVQSYKRDNIDCWGSYGINSWLYDAKSSESNLWAGADATPYWNSLNVKQPDMVPFIVDCVWVDGWPTVSDVPPRDGTGIGALSTIYGMSRFCIDRHMKGVNVYFVDNSCRKITVKQLWQLKWSRNFDPTAAPTSFPAWMK